MPDTSHYTDILVRAANVGFDLHARLLHAAHRCIAQGHALAVSWPDWKNQRHDFGLVFRVFGAPDSLAVFAELVSPLASNNLVYVIPAQPTPATSTTVVFYRDRAPEKNTEGFIARENRHRQARSIAPSRRQVRDTYRPHNLTMPSASTSKVYTLFIRKGAQGDVHTGGRSYGLGIPVPHF